jgi:hypothetical protein
MFLNIKTSLIHLCSCCLWIFTSVISGFRHEVDENCALLGIWAASSGNFLPTFRDNLSVPSSRIKNPSFLDSWILDPWIWDRRLSRNVGKKLPLLLRNNPEERSSRFLQGYNSLNFPIFSFYHHVKVSWLVQCIFAANVVRKFTVIFKTNWIYVNNIIKSVNNLLLSVSFLWVLNLFM